MSSQENNNTSNTTTTNILTENDLSKVVGMTVDIKMNNREDVITGYVYTIMKSNNLLVLLQSEENEQINSVIINLKYLSDIKLSSVSEKVNYEELMLLNLDKVFENERKCVEKDSLLKKSEKDIMDQ